MPVDLFAQAAAAALEEEEEEKQEEQAPEGGEDEPEDDFNAAWEVLDLARAIYEKQANAEGGDDEVKLKLADTYIALGDVSLETGEVYWSPVFYILSRALFREIRQCHYRLRGRTGIKRRPSSPLIPADRRGALQTQHGP